MSVIPPPLQESIQTEIIVLSLTTVFFEITLPRNRNLMRLFRDYILLLAWCGQYTRGDHNGSTISLEAVTSQDSWIWHAYFGVFGSNNDINVFNQSPLFNPFEDGTTPLVPFTVNGTEYKYPYFLVDGIYPRYAMFVKTISHPTGEKRIRYAKAQEAARKDVERLFGIIKKKWKILREPARQMEEISIRKIMYACCILHNMILKDEDHTISLDYIPDPPVVPQPSDDRLAEIYDPSVHDDLWMDLIDHIHRIFTPGIDR
uniref:protein ALP1-like n=1 Tax=Erigeron canadensis TaxID=72917 RepID=UPI001CB8BA5B|nr:protein ALP1-like [Erigeron canadensis]